MDDSHRRELAAAGSANVPIRIEILAAVVKTTLGKAPHIKVASRGEPAPLTQGRDLNQVPASIPEQSK